MNDPHVEILRYRLEVDETYGRFDHPAPLDHETDAYRMRLEDDLLTVYMKEHHPSVESARARVELDLKAWELDAALPRDHAWLRFVFDRTRSKVVDRNPTPTKEGTIHGEAAITLPHVTLSATGTVTPPSFKEYPKPPKGLEASPEVEVLFDRYQRAIWLDETQLLAVGYVCLSFLEGTTGLKGFQGSRDEVVRRYRIERPVLKTLGDLVSEKGDIREARKLDVGATGVPLSQKERLWVRAAIKTLIRRKAEYDYDPSAAASLPEITMADLPTL